MKPSLFQALSLSPDPLEGHEPNENIYRSAGNPVEGDIYVESRFTGYIPENDYDLIRNSKDTKKDINTKDTKYINGIKYTKTNIYNIAYTTWGNKGPAIIFIHGVPTNRRQWYDVQKRIARFARTASFDLLGMGESDKPRFYGEEESRELQLLDGPQASAWQWKYDSEYIIQVVDSLFPNENVIVCADDWGGGIATWFSALNNDRVDGLIKVDPIDFDGYPVSEIQAMGRASMIKDETQFMSMMGAFDQTLVQIYKSMVHHQSVYNQYKLRDIKFPYVDTDYERVRSLHGENATSLTLRLKYQNIRVLCDRAAILSPALLLPFDDKLNLDGVPVENITMPVTYIWAGPNGDWGVPSTGDSMMPSHQVWLPNWAYPNAKWYNFHYIENADHFVATDRPRLVAEYIVQSIINMAGRDKIADICLGFTGIWKGDEADKIKLLRKIYNK